MEKKHIYTAKVVAATEFEDTKSLSCLMVLKTQDGRAIEDKWVSKSLNLANPICKKMVQGGEVAFEATGRSKDSIRTLSGGEPVYALIGFDPKSVEVLLPGEIVAEEEDASEATLKRRDGMATRALAFITKKVQAALAAD